MDNAFSTVMATFDSLLKLIETRMAEGLIVRTDEVPCLVKGGEHVPLTMPPLPAPLVENFIEEVIGPELETEFDGDAPIEGSYTDGSGMEYTFFAHKEPDGHRIELYSAKSDEIEIIETDPDPQVNSEHLPYVGDAGQKLKRGTEVDPSLLGVIGQGLRQGASDIFLSTGEPPRFRIDGEVEPASSTVITEDQVASLACLERFPDRAQLLAKNKQVDYGLQLQIDGRDARFRVGLFTHYKGIAASLRPIRDRIPSFEELNLPGDMRELGEFQNGLVLITGAAGSGKSTTLAAIVEHINQNRARHIITLEDPIEFQHKNLRSLVHQREVGSDVLSFGDGLRAALRESPDVILLGEMRDLDTIAAALTAAETGHLILSTLHTRDAPSAIDRIIDIFPGEKQPQARLQLAASLKAVISQLLLPVSHGQGRVPAIERLMVTGAVSHLIREGKGHQVQSHIQSGGADDMTTRERSLARLVRAGKITEKLAFENASDQISLRKLLRK